MGTLIKVLSLPRVSPIKQRLSALQLRMSLNLTHGLLERVSDKIL